MCVGLVIDVCHVLWVLDICVWVCVDVYGRANVHILRAFSFPESWCMETLFVLDGIMILDYGKASMKGQGKSFVVRKHSRSCCESASII
jgi:hypothetical protein